VTSTPTEPSLRTRRAYIDWARGVAVLVMIEAHAVDAWTRASARRGPAYRDAIILGGFAAPLFLWLAGVAVVLAATAAVRRGASRTDAAETVCRRGLEIFILAFLFRLQAFIVSPGSHLVALFRVDILNIMGPAIVMAGLIWLLSESPTVLAVAYAGLAAAFAMLAPIARTIGFVDRLPLWVQWYIRPAGEFTTFTVFPWAGFVFAGAAVGALLSRASEDGIRRLHLGLAGVGLVLVGVGFYTASLPSIYQQSAFWTSSPTYFAIRVGVLTTGLAILYAAERLAVRFGVTLTPLERFGRRSLFVYWIHVELVYGYATWPIHGRLPLWGVGVAYVAFTALMYAAVVWWDRFSARPRPWRRRSADRQITLQYKAQSV
jgi:uncharacterized membrane protein